MVKKLLCCLILLIIVPSLALAAEVKLMSTDQLNAHLNDENIVILDARGSWDWVKTDDKIVGAIRAEPSKVNDWADNHAKEKTIVVYCA